MTCIAQNAPKVCVVEIFIPMIGVIPHYHMLNMLNILNVPKSTHQ